MYLAHDVRHRRPVAVRVLRPDLAATLGADRFLQEIETAARFQHPHILPLTRLAARPAGFSTTSCRTSTANRSAEATRLTTGLNATRVMLRPMDGGSPTPCSARAPTSGRSLPSSGVASVSQAEPVTTGTQVIEGFDLSRDRRWLAFDSDRGGTSQLYRMPLAGSGEVEQLTSGTEPAFAPVISPDGREIAYHAFQDGTRQVFVMPAEGGRAEPGDDRERAIPEPRVVPRRTGAGVREGLPDPRPGDDARDPRRAGTLGRAAHAAQAGILGVWAPQGHRC